MRLVEVWPEFGAHGKDTVTLRQVLLHTAGVPGLPPDTSAADLCDWDRMCAVIADAEPWWEPGTRFGYHAKTFGFLLGEVLRRATGDDDLDAAARARHRSARCRRRGPLRCPRAAVATGRPAGRPGRPGPGSARARLAARPGHAAGRGPRRRLRQPVRPPHLRHPLRGHDELLAASPASTRRSSGTSTVSRSCRPPG